MLKNEPISFVMFASLEVLTLVLLKTQFFWYVTPC